MWLVELPEFGVAMAHASCYTASAITSLIVDPCSADHSNTTSQQESSTTETPQVNENMLSKIFWDCILATLSENSTILSIYICKAKHTLNHHLWNIKDSKEV